MSMANRHTKMCNPTPLEKGMSRLDGSDGEFELWPIPCRNPIGAGRRNQCWVPDTCVNRRST